MLNKPTKEEEKLLEIAMKKRKRNLPCFRFGFEKLCQNLIQNNAKKKGSDKMNNLLSELQKNTALPLLE